MKLDSNNHSVFSLKYHLVLVNKYREKVLNTSISKFAEDMFITLGENYHITLLEWNDDKDYVHILFKTHSKTELTKFLNAYKSASSRMIKKEFHEVKQMLWKEHFWSKGFCLLTTGGVTLEVIQDYIQKQGQ
ncbi:IS200/IS605 family transposase [Sporosarcina sp. FA9]|uniref:IS200/IS605 family transposase n=1 Tax=Sporosarcina sp. FA9 TaxID=3413030 RepID=UPI003F654D2D